MSTIISCLICRQATRLKEDRSRLRSFAFLLRVFACSWFAQLWRVTTSVTSLLRVFVPRQPPASARACTYQGRSLHTVGQGLALDGGMQNSPPQSTPIDGSSRNTPRWFHAHRSVQQSTWPAASGLEKAPGRSMRSGGHPARPISPRQSKYARAQTIGKRSGLSAVCRVLYVQTYVCLCMP